MGSPFDNDDHLLIITLVVTVVFQLAFFVVAFAFKFDKVRGVWIGVALDFSLTAVRICTSFDPRLLRASIQGVTDDSAWRV